MSMKYKSNYLVYECTKCSERIIIDEEEQSPEKCVICEDINWFDIKPEKIKPFIL